MERVGTEDYCVQALTAICPAHVNDPVLRDHITRSATEASCSYCTADRSASESIAVTLDDFMNAFMVGVHFFYQPQWIPAKHVQLLTSVFESGDVAHEMLQIAGITHPELVADVVDALDATPDWIPRDWERGSPAEQLTHGWEVFKQLVKHEMRFFFAKRTTGPGDADDMTAEQLLKAVSDVGQYTPGVWPVPCPYPLYRARMASTKSEASNWLNAAQLGPPPPEKAAANRMSPAGISIFYGATDRVTAIAEAGSHTFHRYVVTGEFTPTREIRLIDLTNLPDLPSIFDSANHKRYFGLRFLHKFVQDVTLPVELDGREHIDYVPTQVFTEYMRYSFPAAVDGLMFPSTQGPGKNVVLFFGPAFCADIGSETEATRLSLDTRTVEISRDDDRGALITPGSRAPGHMAERAGDTAPPWAVAPASAVVPAVVPAATVAPATAVAMAPIVPITSVLLPLNPRDDGGRWCRARHASAQSDGAESQRADHRSASCNLLHQHCESPFPGPMRSQRLVGLN